MTDDEFLARALRWRGVDDPCLACRGAGQRCYSSGATWRGGMGVASHAWDVCDACWGSGDRYRTGCDLRRLRDEESQRVAEAAISAVADSCAASPGAGHIGEVMIEFDKLIDRRRSPMSVFATSALLGIRNLIARAIMVQERRL